MNFFHPLSPHPLSLSLKEKTDGVSFEIIYTNMRAFMMCVYDTLEPDIIDKDMRAEYSNIT